MTSVNLSGSDLYTEVDAEILCVDPWLGAWVSALSAKALPQLPTWLSRWSPPSLPPSLPAPHSREGRVPALRC